MTKYVIINKYTEKLYRDLAALYDSTDIPINEDVLLYVQAPDSLAELINLEIPNKILDTENTKYNVVTGTWTVVSKDSPLADVQQNRLAELNARKAEVARYLTIQDLPAKLQTDIQAYSAELNNFVLPEDTGPRDPDLPVLISWPVKPWE